MTKKRRKPNLPQETLERARREMQNAGIIDPAITESRAATAEKAAPVAVSALAARRAAARSSGAGLIVVSETELRAQYSYVISDLRNMAILATVLLGALVVLSFFI